MHLLHDEVDASKTQTPSPASIRRDYLKIVATKRTTADIRANTVTVPPSHFARQSTFCCDEAKRSSHFMSEHSWSSSMALPTSQSKSRASPRRKLSPLARGLHRLPDVSNKRYVFGTGFAQVPVSPGAAHTGCCQRCERGHRVVVGVGAVPPFLSARPQLRELPGLIGSRRSAGSRPGTHIFFRAGPR
jgi:hypothetical protein